MGMLWWVLLLGFSWNGGERRMVMGNSNNKCEFPAIFNFGDSNSDTGAISASFSQVAPPNGETFFGKPMGRVCDGRLIVDFIAETLGLPYLTAYLDSLGNGFSHGANFATAGSTVRPQNVTLFQGGVSPFSLNYQVLQFTQFKSRSSFLYIKDICLEGRCIRIGESANSSSSSSSGKTNVPKPEDFSKALYTFDIGQNDLAAGFRTISDDAVRASIPQILASISQAIQVLYGEGARTFWIHNTGPIGCLPFSAMYYPFKPRNIDKYGCVYTQNDVAQEFNRQLKLMVSQLREQLPHAELTYVDVYSAKFNLISHAKEEGFVDPLKFCCGYGKDGYNAWCGRSTNVNGTIVYDVCDKASMYVSWDGIHYSEAANRWIANHIFNGQLSEPPLPLTQACHRLT
ncbi:GDSL esterase/lipase At5g14450-like isoform X1 [Amborella trichopoda]|uniref:GDSL esterase/lipase At5g14450-like isoform X1 n=1 Tax=Amborella trichopoda TaxID=13333 RepID=UPI0009C16CDC|nr:GDSL esterase/lipase At5g14450-like isoform X1 [Amborella trichopoda]|eukprot:XP_020527624.1 GDSL esterase/lipase At5g14450-like isoform X1 [Amborella trichopoda]